MEIWIERNVALCFVVVYERERAREVQVGGEAERFCDNYGKVQGSELYCRSGREVVVFVFDLE